MWLFGKVRVLQALWTNILYFECCENLQGFLNNCQEDSDGYKHMFHWLKKKYNQIELSCLANGNHLLLIIPMIPVQKQWKKLSVRQRTTAICSMHLPNLLHCLLHHHRGRRKITCGEGKRNWNQKRDGGEGCLLCVWLLIFFFLTIQSSD